MSLRGLLIALLCGVIGVGGGALVAYAVQPHAANAGDARPIAAVSPSVPIDQPPSRHYAQDIDYPALSPDLALPWKYHIANHLAQWTYHVPQGWQAYSVCTPPPGETCSRPDDTLIPRKKVDRQKQVRFRPTDEPLVGGYSLRVKILDNTQFNPQQMKPTKIVGFRQAFTNKNFSIIKRTKSAVYFTYVAGGNHLRYNYFQWFAVPNQPNATLEMSVSGRRMDAPGLQALFDRFADNLTGRVGA